MIQIYIIADAEGLSKKLNSKMLGTISNIIEKEITSIIGIEKTKQISLRMHGDLKANQESLKDLYESFRNYVEIDEVFRTKFEGINKDIIENTGILFISNKNEQSILETVNSGVVKNDKYEFIFGDID